MLGTSRNTAKSMLGNLSFEGPLVFCVSETRGIVGVEESRDGIHSADSTLGKGPCDIRACQVERS